MSSIPRSNKYLQYISGDYRLYFGKHKGRKLSEIPRFYLEWFVKTKPKNKSFNKARRMTALYLNRQP